MICDIFVSVMLLWHYVYRQSNKSYKRLQSLCKLENKQALFDIFQALVFF